MSRTTVRQALYDLVAEGVLYLRQGCGTFVAPAPIVEPLNKLKGHVEELQLRGFRPQVRIVDFARAPAPAETQAPLHLSVDEEVLYSRRVISLEGKPILLLDVCIPTRIGSSISHADLMELPTGAAGTPAGQGRTADRRASGPARRDGAPGDGAGRSHAAVVRTAFSPSRQPLVWSRACYPGDRYQYVVELQRE